MSNPVNSSGLPDRTLPGTVQGSENASLQEQGITPENPGGEKHPSNSHPQGLGRLGENSDSLEVRDVNVQSEGCRALRPPPGPTPLRDPPELLSMKLYAIW